MYEESISMTSRNLLDRLQLAPHFRIRGMKCISILDEPIKRSFFLFLLKNQNICSLYSFVLLVVKHYFWQRRWWNYDVGLFQCTMLVLIRIVKHRYLIDQYVNGNEKCPRNRYRIMKKMKVIWKIIHQWLHLMVGSFYSTWMGSLVVVFRFRRWWS